MFKRAKRIILTSLKNYQSILRAVGVYENLLHELTEENFTRNPPDGSWSYSETYSHIFTSGILSFSAIQTCIDAKGIEDKKALSLPVRLILFLGTFPPGRIKAPQKIAALVKKISKKEAEELIQKFKSKLDEVHEQMHLADLNQKVAHPRLGLLNAPQWLRFIEIHTLHHVKQLRRIKKSLG